MGKTQLSSWWPQSCLFVAYYCVHAWQCGRAATISTDLILGIAEGIPIMIMMCRKGGANAYDTSYDMLMDCTNQTVIAGKQDYGAARHGNTSIVM